MESRGVRNHNPGNIRHVKGVTWQGQSAVQTDPAFVQFDDPVYGIRAIARIMSAYERQGIDTLGGAIDRWAPPNENNSQAYVDAVCNACSVGADTPVRLTGAILQSLIKAIIQHENGAQPYSDDQIDKGIALA
jgi:hypothetical protein